MEAKWGVDREKRSWGGGPDVMRVKRWRGRDRGRVRRLVRVVGVDIVGSLVSREGIGDLQGF